jgi:glycerol-3-phosphate acyltransferase PlsY
MSVLSYLSRDVVVFIVAYLVGSLPFSYIFARLIKGVDVTKEGSRNMGATNVLRTAGPFAALCAFLGDFLKAVLLLAVLRRLLPTPSQETVLIASVAVVLGHDFSVLAGFKGGKGVATTFAVVSMLSWPVALVALGIWAGCMFATRIVSIASIATLGAFPIIALLFGEPWLVVVTYLLLAVLGIVRHATNIDRLRKGTESRLDGAYFRRR